MKHPTDADIAGKLDGMECDGLKIYRNSNNWVWIRNPNNPFSDGMTANASKFLSFCRAVVERVDGPAKPTDIKRIIYALQLWMKRIVMGVPAHSQEGWEVRWERLEKVITDWKTKGEMPK